MDFEPPPSYSADTKQTLDGSPPNSPPPPPPAQTLDDLLLNESNLNCLSPIRDEIPNDHSDSAFLLDANPLEDGEKEELCSSPWNSVPALSSSHWSSTPWSSQKAAETSASGWPDWVPVRDTNRWLSDTDANPLDSDWSEPLPLQEETEPKPLVSVSLASSFGQFNPAVGAGLANLGNTCFLNAILQCFTHTVPLVQSLMSYNHPSPCEREIDGFCVLCALRDLIELSLASTGRVVSPWKLVNNLSYISSDFRRFQQEDAHEFLQCLLDRLGSCCTYSKTKDTSLSSVDENLVNQVFGGRLISKLQCCNCGHCSDTYEPLIDLSLEIENVSNLPSALESFTKVEKIEDSETKFTCENCKEEVSVEKQLMLDQAPSIAAFHLKRFKNDGSYVEKIDKYVEFPLELDLLPFVDGSQDNSAELKYDLYAIVVHIGFSSSSGHYYCFIRSAPDAWYMLDDSKVTRVREDFVLSQEAYILFYAKQGTPWFSDFMEMGKASLDPYISNYSPSSVLENMDHICISPSNVASNRSSEVDEARGDGFGINVDSNGSRHDGVEVNEATDDSNLLLTPVPWGTGNCYAGTSCNVETKISPSAFTDHERNQNLNEVENSANVTLLTPPRSPSPDIYAEEPPVTHSIPRDRLMSEKHVPCKRELVRDLDDSERNQACKLLKGMPNDRRSKFLAAMNGGGNKKVKPSSTRSKANVNNFKRAVAAGW